MSGHSFEHKKTEIQATQSLPGNMEHKSFDWELKGLDDSGKLSMYVATFNSIDRGGDIIEPGAFANTDEFVRSGWLGTNHSVDKMPIGFPLSAIQDSKGLLCEFQLHSTAEAQAARTTILERMRAYKDVAGSIGYKIRPGGSKQSRLDGKSIRRLTSLDIYEASWVNLPMNPAAQVIAAKSMETDESKLIAVNELKHWLDEQFKAGRIISSATHKKLSGHIDASIKELTDAKAFLDQHNPDAEPADDLEDGPLVGGGGRVVGKAALLNSLRLRALRSRIKVASLHRE